eukprot:UN23900
MTNFNFDLTKGNGISCSWSNDGKMISVSTSKGYCITYMIEITLLVASSTTNFAFLSSLQEVSVFKTNGTQFLKLALSIEPTLIKCSETHVLVSFNDIVWLYSFENSESPTQLTYVAAIQDICLHTNYLVVLADGNIYLTDLRNDLNKRKKIPEGNDSRIQCMSLGGDFYFIR